MARHRKPRKEVHPAVPSVVYFAVGALLLFGASFTVSDQVDDAVDPYNRNGVTVPLDIQPTDTVDSVTAPLDGVTVIPTRTPIPAPQSDTVEITESTAPVEVTSIVPNPPSDVQPRTVEWVTDPLTGITTGIVVP